MGKELYWFMMGFVVFALILSFMFLDEIWIAVIAIFGYVLTVQLELANLKEELHNSTTRGKK